MKYSKPQKISSVIAKVVSMFALLSLFWLSLSGCSSGSHLITTAPPEEDYIVDKYKIGSGDTVQVNVWKNDEISRDALVRPDGMISLPLVGDIRALGKTTDELATDVTEKLVTYIRTPQVSVSVENPSSADFQQRVRITGAVNDPTAIPYKDGMTVMDLVLAAGGLNEFAAGNRAVLHRKNNEGESLAYAIKLRNILSKGDLATNYNLRPSDVIAVPERRI